MSKVSPARLSPTPRSPASPSAAGRSSDAVLPRYATLLVTEVRPYVLHVVLNRPEVHNAMNTQMGKDLRHLVSRWLPESEGKVRCIVFSGAGGRAFGAGGDLKERRGMDDATWQAQHTIFEEAIYGILELEIPKIAAVHGVALGGGCELALSCDFIYAAQEARFGLPEITLGIFPGTGGTQHLPRAIGLRRAKERILTGRPFSAQEAETWGLVNAVFPPQDLLPATFDTAEHIARHSPVAVRLARRSMHQGVQLDLRNALHLDLALYQQTVGSEDRREGVNAFNEKRTPHFKGR